MNLQSYNSHKRRKDKIMDPAEIDESGSLHFQAASHKEDVAPVRERKVSFHGRVRCRRSKVPSVNPDDVWFTKEELAGFRKQDNTLQKLVSEATSLIGDDDTEEVSFVGLNSQKERKLRIKRIHQARICVFGEQMKQRENFYDKQDDLSQPFELNQEAIAELFSTFSKRARKAAHMKGLQVSWHVENFLEEELLDVDASRRSCSQRSCSQRSKSASGCGRPVRNSSLRSAGSLIARLTTAAS